MENLQPTSKKYSCEIIADTGATHNFAPPTAHIREKQKSEIPITVQMANGYPVLSTHTGHFNLPELPPKATHCHVLQSLSHPLLAISQVCDAGYEAKFDRNSVKITHGTKTIVEGTRNRNGLWVIPTKIPTANFTVHDATTRSIVKFLHLSLFSPTKSTLLKAVQLNQLLGWPGLTATAIKKYLQLEEPTIMGHMDQQRKNVRSTKIEVAPAPAEAPRRTQQVVFAVTEVPTGTIYTDQTGNFPTTSSRGIKAVMVLYDYDSNAILIEGIASKGQSELLRAYMLLLNRLKSAGLTPKMQRLDNEASGMFKKF